MHSIESLLLSRYSHVNETEANATQLGETDKGRMHSVEESLLRSRHLVGSETDAAVGTERASTRERERNIRSEEKPALYQEEQPEKRERKKRIGSSEAECIQSKKACYEAAIQSEAKPTLP
jgi:hypothetical protein